MLRQSGTRTSFWKAKVELLTGQWTYITTSSDDFEGAKKRMEMHSMFLKFITQPYIIQ